MQFETQELSLLEDVTPKETLIMQPNEWESGVACFKPTINITRPTQATVQSRQINLPWIWQEGMLNSLYLGFCCVATSSLPWWWQWRSVSGLSSHAFLFLRVSMWAGEGEGKGVHPCMWFCIQAVWWQPKTGTRDKQRWDSRRFQRQYGFVLD